MIPNVMTMGNSRCRWGLSWFQLIALWVLLPPVLVISSHAHAAEPYRVRFADPLEQPWRISRYTELQGRGVRCLAEDPTGQMWFGVSDGAVSYDGIHWQDHPFDKEFAGDPVESLAARSDGSMVAATPHGLFELDGDQWRCLFPSGVGKSCSVTAIKELSGEQLWGCSPWGLLRLTDGKSTLFTSAAFRLAAERQGIFDSIVGLPDQCLPSRNFPEGTGISLADGVVAALSAASPARASGLRVGDKILSAEGESRDLSRAMERAAGERVELVIKRFDSGLEETISFTTAEITDKHRLPAMHSVMQDRRGRIWCGANEGRILVCDDGGTNWRTWSKQEGLLVGKRPAAIELTDNRILVVSTQRNGGACLYDGKTWTSKSLNRLTGTNYASAAAQTVDETIWVSGLNRLYLQRYGNWKNHDTRDVRIPGDSHRMLVASDDSLWILGYGQYPVRIAMSADEFWSFEDLSFQCSQGSDYQWFIDTSTNRIVRYDGSSAVTFGSEDGTIDTPSGVVAVPGKGVVAFGSHQDVASVSTFDGSTWTKVDFPKLAHDLSSKGFTVARDGRVWIGARGNRGDDQAGGVIVGFGNDWQRHLPPEAPKYAPTIMELPDGRMMLAGGYGVAVYDGVNWTRLHGELLENTPCPGGAIDREGTVWLATRTRGVLRYRDDEWTAFSTADGLLANEVSTIAVGPGEDVWASTSNGLCRFDGSRFHRVNLPGHFGRRSLRAEEGGGIWLDGSLRWMPDERAPNAVLDNDSIIIEADSSTMITWHGADQWNRTPAADLTWSYRIDQGPWSPFRRQTQLVLRDLSSGDHTVEVRSRDHDFNVSDISNTLTVAVLPPFWMRPWFVVPIAILLATLAGQSVSLIRRGVAIRNSNAQLERARSQLAEQFAEKSAQFRAVCDCSPIGIFVTDTAGKLTYLNQYLKRISGLSSRLGQDAGWVNAVHSEDRDRVTRTWNQFVKAGNQYECSARFLHSDGKIICFDVVADRIEIDGELLGYVGAVEDTTAQILASEELQASNLKLREALGQLEQAQDQAIRRERLSALGQMAAGVAHDVSNSLAPLLTYAELLANCDQLEGTSRRWVELIRLGVSDTAGIVKRLDHFYRDSHNREFLDTFRMSELVTQSVELTRPRWQDAAQAEGKEIEVKVESESKSFADGQSAQIRAVMTNLIFNAVDAISGRGRITIQVTESSDQVIVTVSDTGSGMTSEQLDHCLEPFYTSKEQGSGLGLSECHGIVRQHGGELQITSQPGQGTQVRILLPLSSNQTEHASFSNDRVARSSSRDDWSSSRDDQVTTDTQARGDATDVLYIDDDPMVRRSTVALIKALGMTVETAGDGPSGLNRLQEANFRMVMCDQGLPGMDGIGVLNQIKQQWPNLPVVIVSGWSLPDLGNGIQPDGFLEKPVGYDQLQTTLKRVLRSIHAA